MKRTQAGLSGHCPFCQGLIEIPDVTSEPSTSSLSAENVSSGNDDRPDSDLIRTLAVDRPSNNSINPEDHQVTVTGIDQNQQPSGTEQAEFSLFLDRPQVNTKRQRDDSPQMSDTFLLEKPELPQGLGQIDPITAEPQRIWYYRNRDANERGPLKGKHMRKALDSNRVTVGTLVWRDDWEEWLPAESVFPNLAARVADLNRTGSPNTLKLGNNFTEIIADPKFRWSLGTLLTAVGLMVVGILVYWLIRVIQ